MRAQAKVVRVLQGTPEWHEFRRTHIGSSDAPVIVGESPFRSPIDLYMEKVSGEEPEVDPGTAHRFLIGHRMEPVALDLYREKTGRKIRKGRVYESRDLPWLAASLDAETEDRLVEAKWTTSSRMEEEVPGDVLVQVTHQMGVTGVQVADVAVLTPRGFSILEVPFDRAFWDKILVREEKFRERIRLLLPPPPDGSEASRKALGRLFPADTGEMLPADPETASLVRLILDGKDRLKGMEDQVAEWENALRFLIGAASGIEGPGFRVTYRKRSDSQRVGWSEYASGLERIIGEIAPDRAGEVGVLKGLYTITTEGPRVLLVKRTEVQG